MKNLYLALFFAITMLGVACNKKDQPVTFHIKFKNNVEKQHVFLELLELDGSVPMILDSMVVEKGNSELKLNGGTVDPEALYRVILDDNSRFFLLVPDISDIKVEFDLANFELQAINSPATNEMKSLLSGFNLKVEKLNALREQVQSAPQEMDSSRVVMEQEFMKQLNEAGSYVSDFAKNAK